MHGLDATKSTDGGQPQEDAPRSFIGVRILAHPAVERVGECAVLFDAEERGRTMVSRHAPSFRTSQGHAVGPLESTRITRTPLQIDRDEEGLRFSHQASTPIEINGTPLQGEASVPAKSLQEGAIVLFGRDLALWVGRVDSVEAVPLREGVPPWEGLVGDSSALRRLRREIAQVAALDVPVLIRGETGSGKELVAKAIHLAGPRHKQPYIPVNIAALAPHLAVSELFGHKKNSFTGATKDRDGVFGKANRGTLFLDEIGEASWEVQALLLRVAQFKVIQPVGGVPEKVDVRLVAATDANLEDAVAKGTFREPLRQRFAYDIFVPPLRARRDDIGVLFYHLLRQHLREFDELRRLPSGESPTPFVPASLVARLAQLNWPGNVRELDKVALRFALENRDRERGYVTEDLQRLLARASRAPGEMLTGREPQVPESAPAKVVTPSVVPRSSSSGGPQWGADVRRATVESAPPSSEPSEDALLAALEEEGYSAARVARRLGVTRSYVDRRLDRLPQARKAKDLSAADVEAALALVGGDVKAAAASLRISVRSLRLQLGRFRDAAMTRGRRSDVP